MDKLKVFFKTIKEYWQIIVIVIGTVAAGAIFPYRLSTAEGEIREIKDEQKLLVQQTTTIGAWVQQAQQEKQFESERYESAPPGWRWDPSRKEYVQS